jgi:hypothetical protein
MHVVILAESLHAQAGVKKKGTGLQVDFVGPYHNSTEHGWKFAYMHKACALKYAPGVPDKHAEDRLGKLLGYVDDERQFKTYTDILVDYFHAKSEPRTFVPCRQSFSGNTDDIGYTMTFSEAPANVHWCTRSDTPWPFLMSYAVMVLEAKIRFDAPKAPAMCNALSFAGVLRDQIGPLKDTDVWLNVLEWSVDKDHHKAVVVCVLTMHTTNPQKHTPSSSAVSAYPLPDNTEHADALEKRKKLIAKKWDEVVELGVEKKDKWSYTKSGVYTDVGSGVEYKHGTLKCNVAPVVVLEDRRRVWICFGRTLKLPALQAFAKLEPPLELRTRGVPPPRVLYSVLDDGASLSGFVKLHEQ